MVHLGLFEAGRGRQTQALIDAVKESAPNGEPVIIAGDFNDWRNTLSDRLRKELGVAEVFDELNGAQGRLENQQAGQQLRAARTGDQPGPHFPGRAAMVPPGPHLCARLQG